MLGDLLSGAFDFISDMFGGLIDGIGSAITDAISTLVGKGLFYILVDGLLSILKIFWDLFSVFAGITKVRYGSGADAETDYIINVFFRNQEVQNVYWGMAMIGIVMVFFFTLVTVFKKTFDLYGKQQKSFSAILGGTFKGILFIMLMSVFFTTVINLSGKLMQQVNYLFNNSKNLFARTDFSYTDRQYAAMARVLNTVGNYSLNPGSNNRYNVNACFNEIRGDLIELKSGGIFDLPYEMNAGSGKDSVNWQSAIQKVINSADLSKELLLDVYYEGPTKALTDLMDILRQYPNLDALKEYHFNYAGYAGSNVSLDRVVFLVATSGAAKNKDFNVKPQFTDAVRAPYYYGQKNLYDLSAVNEDFEVKVGAMSYVLLAFVAYMTIKNLWRCIMQCIVRIFSLLGLYLVAPPFIALIPMDDGEKFKQWMTAFIIQTFGIFGTVIPMRLLIMFIPMIFGSDLTISESSLVDMIAKILLIIGGLEATNALGGVITGILANNAGMQAISSINDAQAKADSSFAVGSGVVLGAGKALALGAGKMAADVTGLTTIGRGISKAGNALLGAGGKASEHMASHGGLIGSILSAPFSSRSNNSLPKNNEDMRK